jgi:hypothetical protein
MKNHERRFPVRRRNSKSLLHLEDELTRELHGAWIVGKHLFRMIESRTRHCLEAVTRSEAWAVHVIDCTGLVLRMIKDVECLRADLDRVTIP